MTSTSSLNLPERARVIADQLAAGQMLGAARNVRAILEILGHVAEEADPNRTARVREVANHYVATRGAETAAVANALHLFLQEFPERGDADWVRAFATDFGRRQERALQEVIDNALDVLGNATSILAYDYSSTVDRVLRAWAAQAPGRRVFIPESRTLDGGRPYVEALRDIDLDIVFLSDGAIASMTARADAVVEGVETLAEDGSFSNTIGSVTTAICAQYYGTPYYGATSLMKVARGVDVWDLTAGTPRDFRETYGELDGVDARYVENEWVPSQLVTGHITECGLIAPSQVADTAAAFFAGDGDGASS